MFPMSRRRKKDRIALREGRSLRCVFSISRSNFNFTYHATQQPDVPSFAIKVLPPESTCKKISKQAFPDLGSVAADMMGIEAPTLLEDASNAVATAKEVNSEVKNAKDECGCSKLPPAKLSDEVVAIDYGMDKSFSAQSKLSAILLTLMDMQELQ